MISSFNSRLSKYKKINEAIQFNNSKVLKRVRYDKTLYLKKTIDEIIYNDKCHIVAKFKDFLIIDDTSEFLKRIYIREELNERLKKIFTFYESYSQIYPNYTSISESKFLYKNIQRKQKMIDKLQKIEKESENNKNQNITDKKILDIDETSRSRNDTYSNREKNNHNELRKYSEEISSSQTSLYKLIDCFGNLKEKENIEKESFLIESGGRLDLNDQNQLQNEPAKTMRIKKDNYKSESVNLTREVSSILNINKEKLVFKNEKTSQLNENLKVKILYEKSKPILTPRSDPLTINNFNKILEKSEKANLVISKGIITKKNTNIPVIANTNNIQLNKQNPKGITSQRFTSHKTTMSMPKLNGENNIYNNFHIVNNFHNILPNDAKEIIGNLNELVTKNSQNKNMILIQQEIISPPNKGVINFKQTKYNYEDHNNPLSERITFKSIKTSSNEKILNNYVKNENKMKSLVQLKKNKYSFKDTWNAKEKENSENFKLSKKFVSNTNSHNSFEKKYFPTKNTKTIPNSPNRKNNQSKEFVKERTNSENSQSIMDLHTKYKFVTKYENETNQTPKLTKQLDLKNFSIRSLIQKSDLSKLVKPQINTNHAPKINNSEVAKASSKSKTNKMRIYPESERINDREKIVYKNKINY